MGVSDALAGSNRRKRVIVEKSFKVTSPFTESWDAKPGLAIYIYPIG